MIKIKIEKRDPKAKLSELRKDGMMPAVFYGKKEKSTPISVSQGEFLKVWGKAGETSVVNLALDGEEELESLIQEVDVNPVNGMPRHADFYVFEKGHKLEVEIPLEFIGVSPAVKDLGGLLVKVLHELKISAMPKDLPQEIKVDISRLETFESRILAKDIVLPAGVELLENPEEVVALAAEPKEEKEEIAPAPDLANIEVAKKGKEAKEGEEGEGEETPKKE